MEPIFDRHGQVIAWLNDGVVFDRNNQYRAFVRDGAIYTYPGRYLGRFENGFHGLTAGCIRVSVRSRVLTRTALPIGISRLFP